MYDPLKMRLRTAAFLTPLVLIVSFSWTLLLVVVKDFGQKWVQLP